MYVVSEISNLNYRIGSLSSFCLPEQNGWRTFISQWRKQYLNIVFFIKMGFINFPVRNLHFIFRIFVHWMLIIFCLFIVASVIDMLLSLKPRSLSVVWIAVMLFYVTDEVLPMKGRFWSNTGRWYSLFFFGAGRADRCLWHNPDVCIGFASPKVNSKRFIISIRFV